MENNTSTPKKFIIVQNNSFGTFDYPEWDGPSALGGVCSYYERDGGMAVDVWVMAHDRDEACMLASKYAGVYFDGVSKGRDCKCCGDRWYDAREF